MSLLQFLFFILSAKSMLSIPVKAKAEDYRLPDIYSPTSYDIQLSLTPDAFTNTSNEFTGTSTITFSLTNDSDYVALHAEHNYIRVTKVSFENQDIPSEDYTVDNVTDILKITLNQTYSAGATYVLSIEYTGVLSTSDMYGFYKSYYIDGTGATKYLATTQFEATYARRAFPCFDEPALKATFDFSITVPTGLSVLFNTPLTNTSSNSTSGLTTLTFGTTPKIPTYLIAFIVSEFTCTTGQSIGTVPYQVCSRNESAPTRELAVDLGPKLLSSLNNFTGFDYSLGMAKMDQVAIPDFAAGAMENWGLVTYRETALLWDENESSNRYKQRVATVIAHEFAHQWFGNLVTMKWWSEIFLNEGFATYFEFATTHEIFPAWELDKQFVIEDVHDALLSDALENAQALQSSCSTPAEISSKFSTISYSKGGSILRMVEHFMKLENFKAGLNNYLVSNQFNNTIPEHLWIALIPSVDNTVSNLPATLPTVMSNWIQKSGYPLLSVKLEENKIVITQKRFLLSGEDRLSKWFVPITYTTSVDSNKFQTTTPNAWLTTVVELNITLPDNWEWIILNNQQTGYYRVNYDDTLWERIKTALLKENFDGIIELNRAQIVNDLFNLARANELKYSNVFATIRFLANDTSYFPWYPAFTGFNFLLRRVGENSELGKAISSDILELMANLFKSVPISTLKEDDQVYTLKQVLALTWACRLGNEDCVEEVTKIFKDYQSSSARPNKNLRSVVYCNALRYSTNSSDWNFLWEAYTKETDLATEQVTILSALGCTKDAALLTEYLKKSITEGSGIRSQDASSVFSSVYSNAAGVDVAFEFLISNYEAIAERYQSMNSLGNLIKGIAERFTTEAQITKLKNFIAAGDLPEQFQVAANEALETAETNLKWLKEFENDLKEYYNIKGSNGVTLSSSLVAVVLAIFFLFISA